MKNIFAWLSAILIIASGAQAHAQGDYPNRLIKFVVPYQAGSTPDVLARVIAPKLGALLKQPVVIDNKPGAAGMLGEAYGAKAPADGYTLVLLTNQSLVHKYITKNIPIDTLTDFSPIQMIGATAQAMVVSSDNPAKTLADFMKQSRGKSLNYGSGGIGSAGHLAGVAMVNLGALNGTHVPYKGAPDSLNALLGHQVDFVLSPIPSVISLAHSGKLRVLAVTSRNRAAALPNVPTVVEAYPPGYVFDNWYLVAAPTGTPARILEKLATAVNQVAKQPDTGKSIERLGLTQFSMPPQNMHPFLMQEDKKIGGWIKATGVHPQ